MDKLEKKQFVTLVRDHLNNSQAIIVTHYHGLTVSDLNNLRKEMRKVGAQYKIVKNSLAKLAILGTDYEELNKLFTGPVAIAISKDPISAVKAIVSFAKTKDNLKIIGGIVEKKLIDESTIKILSTMPSLDELRAKIIGIINAPASKIASILQAPGAQIARVIKAHSDKIS